MSRYPRGREFQEHHTAEEIDHVMVDSPVTRSAAALRLEHAVYLLFGIIEGLIAIRFVLRAFGANPNVAFAEAIYTITGPFVAPFNGLFGTPQFNGSVLEWHSLVAIVMYALLAWVIGRVIWLLLADTRGDVTTRTVRTEHEHDHERDLAA
jgi:YggT family protein